MGKKCCGGGKIQKKIYIFTAGRFGIEAKKALEEDGIFVSGFFDNDKNIQGKIVEGLEVLDIYSFSEDLHDIVIVNAPRLYKETVRKQLLQLGMKDEQIIDFICWKTEYLDKEQYFDEDIIKYCENEIFVDVGSCDMGTSLNFAKRCPHYKKIVAFEPIRECYEKCISESKKISGKEVKIINAGVWDQEGVMRVNYRTMGSSQLVQEHVEDEGLCNVMTLDNCDEVSGVTFIKMDIEGAEMKALIGASRIIREYKPKLAICVYHKREDIVDIPLYIKGLVPEYSFYLRHYNDNSTETVLYAVIK